MAQESFTVRPLVAADQEVLWDIFHVALWDPPPAPLRPRSVLEHPDVRIYAEAALRHATTRRAARATVTG